MESVAYTLLIRFLSRLNNTKHDYLLFSNFFFLINTVKSEVDRGFPKRGVQAQKGSEHTECMCGPARWARGHVPQENVGKMEPLGSSKMGVQTPLM